MVITSATFFCLARCPYHRQAVSDTVIRSCDVPFFFKVWGDQPVVRPSAPHSSSCWIGLLLIGTADSRGFQACSWTVAFLFQLCFVGTKRPFRISWLYVSVQAILCLNGFLLSQECCMVPTRTVSPQTTSREDLLQVSLQQLKPDDTGQNLRKENTSGGELTLNVTFSVPTVPSSWRGGEWHGAHLCRQSVFHSFSSLSLKFHITKNIFKIVKFMKFRGWWNFFPKSGLNSWRHLTSRLAFLFHVFKSFTISFSGIDANNRSSSWCRQNVK